MKESAKYLCHATVSRVASHRMCYVKIVLPLVTQQKQWLHKEIYFAFSTKPAKHRAVHRASLFIQNHVTIEEKQNAPKPDTKTSQNHRVEKTGNASPRPRQRCDPRCFRVHYVRSHGAIHKHVTANKGWEKIQMKVKASV